MNLNPKTRQEYEATCKEMAERAMKTATTPEEHLQIKSTLARLLSDYNGDDKVVNVQSLKDQILAVKQEPSIDLPHQEMNKATDGIRSKQLIVVSGTTKQGKSQFLYDMVNRIPNIKPLLLYFEDRPVDMIKKMLRFDQQYQIPEFYTPELYTDDSLDWIKMKMLEAKYKWGTKVVVIDNLHYITQSQAVQVSRYDKLLSSYAKELKEFAIKWGITIFLIVHMNKTPDNRAPTVFDIADSAGIGQIADKVWFVQRNPDDEKQTIWYSDRDRQTGFKGKVVFEFVKGGYYEDMAAFATEQIKKEHKGMF